MRLPMASGEWDSECEGSGVSFCIRRLGANAVQCVWSDTHAGASGMVMVARREAGEMEAGTEEAANELSGVGVRGLLKPRRELIYGHD